MWGETIADEEEDTEGEICWEYTGIYVVVVDDDDGGGVVVVVAEIEAVPTFSFDKSVEEGWKHSCRQLFKSSWSSVGDQDCSSEDEEEEEEEERGRKEAAELVVDVIIS